MSGWRSTTLQLAAKHCPRALDFYEAGAPYDRSIFAVGTAAHAVLEAIGKASAAAGRWLSTEEAEEVSRIAAEEIIANGRAFEGEPEPPMSSAAAWEGRDLAMSYQRDAPLPYDMRYEEGLACSRDWQLCPFDSGAWLRCRIDAVGTRLPDWWDDEDGAAGPILEITDYKSAWPTDASELRTIQRKIQAVLAWLAWGEGHDALRLRVVNIRRAQAYDSMIYPGTEEGAAVLARWRADIESEIRAREHQARPGTGRPAAPGVNCYGCPYLSQCDAAQGYLSAAYPASDGRSLAVQYAVLSAMAESLEDPLREATAEGPIEVSGGFVGIAPKPVRMVRPNAAERLAELWLRRLRSTGSDDVASSLPGLLTAMGLGVGQVDKLLRHLYKGSAEERERRAKLLGEMTETRRIGIFGIHREEAEQ